MNTYELVVLLHPDLEIDPTAPIEKIEKLIENVDGKIAKRDNWGKKRLAYPINKQQFAVYVYFEIQLAPAGVRPLNDTILLTEEVMRHLIVLHEENKPAPVKKNSKQEKPESKETAESGAK